jgi:hypothetical protein
MVLRVSFNHEDGGSMFLRNTGIISHIYVMQKYKSKISISIII